MGTGVRFLVGASPQDRPNDVVTVWRISRGECVWANWGSVRHDRGEQARLDTAPRVLRTYVRVMIAAENSAIRLPYD